MTSYLALVALERQYVADLDHALEQAAGGESFLPRPSPPRQGEAVGEPSEGEAREKRRAS